MKNDVHFWVATMIRGLLAMLVGSAVMVVPDMTTTLLLLPLAIVFSVLCLGCYGVLDSSIVLVMSFNATSRLAKVALRVQGVLGLTVGLLLLFVVYEHIQLHWFLPLIATQAILAAVGEYMVAKHALIKSTSLWNYSAATIALLCGIGYAIAEIRYRDNLIQRDIAWLIYGYLAAFGLAQSLTAAHMLYADHRFIASANDPATEAHLKESRHVPLHT
jgi:hypothetical protein